MNTILNKISKLRKDNELIIDFQNSNRYRIVAIEPNGSRTAYYFSTPIYNNTTQKIINMKFCRKGNIAYLTGSNSHITISENIQMKNKFGSCTLSLANNTKYISDHEIIRNNERIYPTTNGIAIRSSCNEEKTYTFAIETSNSSFKVRSNEKYFALMRERFTPFITISCIGTSDANGSIISPAKIAYQKINDRNYIITITPCSALGKSVLIEANLYEAKLFQDTTVESKNPKINNAFGSIGFIGTTIDFGEQWLYSRIDFPKISNFIPETIDKAFLHIPILNGSTECVDVFIPEKKFCSFGSTWNTKTNTSTKISTSNNQGNYLIIDMTHMFTNNTNHASIYSDGIILKKAKCKNNFIAISTGDCYFNPQILEIKFKP